MIGFEILRHSPIGEFLRMTERSRIGYKILRRPPIGWTPQNDRINFTQIGADCHRYSQMIKYFILVMLIYRVLIK